MTKGKRFRKDDWLELGLRQLAKSGRAGLTVERLCEVSERTRGSFYHHFEGHDAFMEALMDQWKRTYTDDIIDKVESVDDVSKRAQTLSDLALHLDFRLELATRQLAQAHPIAAGYVSQVDETRIAYLARLHRVSDNAPEPLATELARLEYAVFVGAQMIWPEAGAADLAALDATFRRMVVRVLADSKLEL